MLLLMSIDGIIMGITRRKALKMSKHGEKAPVSSEQNNGGRDNDKWLKWISLREEQIENSDKDDSEKDEYRRMLGGLRDYRNKLLDEKMVSGAKYISERERTKKELDDRFKEVTGHIRKHYKNNEATARIAERKRAYEAAKKDIDGYEEWLRRNRFRNEARAWEDQHSQQLRNTYGYTGETKEPEVYFRQQQETWHDYERRLAKNDSITIIMEFIPRIGGHVARDDSSYAQTTKEYFAYLSKIYDQFPRGVGEDNEKYKQRIETAFQNGDLQLAATRALIDPWSEIDQAIETGLTLIETEEEMLASDRDIEPEQRKNLEERVKQHKKNIFKNAVKAEEMQRNREEKETRDTHREGLKLQRYRRIIEKEKAARRRERFRRLGRLASALTWNRK